MANPAHSLAVWEARMDPDLLQAAFRAHTHPKVLVAMGRYGEAAQALADCTDTASTVSRAAALRRVGNLREAAAVWEGVVAGGGFSDAGFFHAHALEVLGLEGGDGRAYVASRRGFARCFEELVGGLVTEPSADAAWTAWRKSPSTWFDHGVFLLGSNVPLLASDCFREASRLLCDLLRLPPGTVVPALDHALAASVVRAHVLAGDVETAIKAAVRAAAMLPLSVLHAEPWLPAVQGDPRFQQAHASRARLALCAFARRCRLFLQMRRAARRAASLFGYTLAPHALAVFPLAAPYLDPASVLTLHSTCRSLASRAHVWGGLLWHSVKFPASWRPDCETRQAPPGATPDGSTTGSTSSSDSSALRHHVVSSVFAACRQRDAQHPPASYFPLACRMALLTSPNTRVVDVCGAAWFTPGLLQLLLHRCPRLHSLNMSWCPVGTHLAPALEIRPPQPPQLGSFATSIADPHASTPSFPVPLATSAFDDVPSSLIRPAPQWALAVLDVSWTDVTDVDLHTVAGTCGGLVSIALAGCNHVTDDGVKALAIGCPLQVVSLASCKHLSDAAVEALAAFCGGLRRLNCANVGTKDAEAVRQAGRPRLAASLRPAGEPATKATGMVEGLSSHAVWALASSGAPLESLVLRGAGATDGSVAALAEATANTLTFLDISFTPVTDVGLGALGTARRLKHLVLHTAVAWSKEELRHVRETARGVAPPAPLSAAEAASMRPAVTAGALREFVLRVGRRCTVHYSIGRRRVATLDHPEGWEGRYPSLHDADYDFDAATASMFCDFFGRLDKVAWVAPHGARMPV